MKKICCVFSMLVLVLSLFVSCGNGKKRMVASYIRTWPLGSTPEEMEARQEHWSSETVKAEYLTDLIIAFGGINMDTWKIYFPDIEDDKMPFPQIWDEVSALKAKYPKLNISVSIGGWGCDGFSQMCSLPERRKIFVQAVVDLVTQKKLDGIDYDWEYPIGPEWGQEIASSPDDGVNFISLLEETRTAFNELTSKTGKHYSISCAIPASEWYFKKLDVIKIASYLDSVKLMSYDFYGGWSDQTGHNSNLYNNPKDPDWGGWSIKQSVDLCLKAGLPRDKIIVGVAFYGRAWKGVKDNGVHGLYQPFEESAYGDGLSWDDIEDKIYKDPSFVRYWDDVGKAPFLYDGNTFISYTDGEELKLVSDYIKKNKLGGVMIWEYGHDINARLLKPLYKSLN